MEHVTMAKEKPRKGKSAPGTKSLGNGPREPGTSGELITFSVRLTEEQRQLVQKAAELKGWTPTSLIRTATIERAAHIINTKTLTKFDFRGLAAEMARSLFERRTVTHVLNGNDQAQIDYLQDHEEPLVLHVPVQPLAVDVAVRLKNAAQYGGAEFLELFAQFAEGAAGVLRERDDVPSPIDPVRMTREGH
jgi:uncharacterized protein (DUF1778 family)